MDSLRNRNALWLRILSFFALAFLSLLLQQGMYIADSVIVGNLLGKAKFAAIEAGTTVLRLPVNLAVGFSSGVTVVMSHALERDHSKTQTASVVVSSLRSAGVFGFALAAAAFGGARVLLRWSEVPSDIFSDTERYFRTYLLGVPAVFLSNVSIGLVRAYEDAKGPLLIMGVSLVFNILLDLVFARFFGLAGAAAATVLAQIGTGVFALVLLRKHCSISPAILLKSKSDKGILPRIVSAGLPVAAQTALLTITGLYVQRAVNLISTDAISQWGLCNRTDTLIWLTIDATVLTITTFFSRAFAANNMKEIRKCVLDLALLGGLIVAVLSCLLYLFAPKLAFLFLPNAEACEAAAVIIRLIVPFYLVYFAADFLAACLRGSGRFWISLFAVITQCAIRLLCVSVLGLSGSVKDIANTYIISWCAYAGLLIFMGIPVLIYGIRKNALKGIDANIDD